MAPNPVQQLNACGQSVWNDNIRRTFVTSGELKSLVEDGVTGVTSNPAIFEKAIGGSPDYDDDLKRLVSEGKNTEEIFRDLASTDIQMGADVLRPVWDRTDGQDGHISIEVSPAAAHDFQKTLEDAHYYWKAVDRPNVMIKIPATPEGLPAVEQCISEGINVNITLIFAVEVYEEVMEAYIRGLERRVEQGLPVDRIASVASFFVSRVDTLIDKLLEDKQQGADEATLKELKELAGKAAIANAKIAYERFQQIFGSERFQKLAAKGARVQRPLWASTSVKNPEYPDTMYVTTLVGRDTVNTMPPQTITAVLDHGVIECDTVTQGVADAHAVIERLAKVGVDMTEVTAQLTRDGVKLFADAQIKLFETVGEKASLIVAQEIGRDEASLDGHQAAVDARFHDMTESGFTKRLWEKDPALWKPNPDQQSEITDRLGWLTVSGTMLENRARFTELATAMKSERFTHAVVLGMGGSSLAPYVLAQSFGKQPDYPELLVLDSTDPAAILDIERRVALDTTLFLVSTKSGTTTETLSFFETFWEKVKASKGDGAGRQFVAITDPGTPLERQAKERGFRECFVNPPDIGGRYSAMSCFGMVPAAVMGIDVETLLKRAQRMEQACAPSVPAVDNPGAWLGAIMASLAGTGQDKVTFFVSPGLDTLGLWLEQLLAESTGKEGKGLIPVPDNPPAALGQYGEDRLFVYIRLDGADNTDLDSQVESLERGGRPVVRLQMGDTYDLGAEFFRWEFATAVAGALLGINAFDQPNVQESKDNTKRVLNEYLANGTLPQPQSLAAHDGLSVFVNGAASALVSGRTDDVAGTLAAYVHRVGPPQYLAIMAYIAPSPEHDALLESIRLSLRDATRAATTLGYGPRFLHSTGQLHKGGPAEGVFFQITAEAHEDQPVPGQKYSYQTLIQAQALGDFESLQQHDRPALRIHLTDQSTASLQKLALLVERAVKTEASTTR